MASQQQVALEELTVEQLSQIKQQLDEVGVEHIAFAGASSPQVAKQSTAKLISSMA